LVAVATYVTPLHPATVCLPGDSLPPGFPWLIAVFDNRLRAIFALEKLAQVELYQALPASGIRLSRGFLITI